MLCTTCLCFTKSEIRNEIRLRHERTCFTCNCQDLLRRGLQDLDLKTNLVHVLQYDLKQVKYSEVCINEVSPLHSVHAVI